MASNTWWYERPHEQHIRDTRESLSPRVLTSERWFENGYSAPQLAYLVYMGYVTGWPWELTRRGQVWWRQGGTVPPDSNRVWSEEWGEVTCESSTEAV